MLRAPANSQSLILPQLARGSALARVIAAAWLVVYAAIGVGFPVLDAQTDHSDRVVAHWEDASDTDCPPTHDPAVCQVCQQITAASKAPADRAIGESDAARSTEPPLDAQRRPLRSVAAAIPSTRAPPVI